MSKLTLTQGLLKNLAEEIPQKSRSYLSRQKAYEMLKQMTGQDFGLDVTAWASYLKSNDKTLETKVTIANSNEHFD